MAWTDRLPVALQRLAAVGADEHDSEDVRLDKAMLTLVSALIASMSFVWVALYLSIGLPGSAAIPFAYQLCVVVCLVTLARTNRIDGVRTVLLLLMLVLPFALQSSLGGFANGSAVAAWAGITPVLAFLFGVRSPWSLVVFVVLLVVAAAFETTLAEDAPHIDSGIRAASFALNLAGPAVAGFLALRYFTNERDRSRAELVEAHRLLGIEQERSEQLLLNILPAPIADRLRGGETTIAESQPDVSVLFADIVGFTPLGAALEPAELVRLLNEIFVAFDDLVEAAGLEKIKTVGDAYMVVGGLPTPRAGHLTAMLDVALAMIETMSTIRPPHGAPLRVRIGVDSGPVVAGVIGRRKFSYDVWGDTVNTASRMESHGVPGRVQVTERVARSAAADFTFEGPRSIDVKGKGPMTTFLVGTRTADRDAG